ncbi:hypothetical protein AB0M54_46985 [Actinoplanes sp. NPDC051470]|uniref:hypothetical protein n=1 Tax=Actinoplanes sp. NPDC051470 TaxID=3157224 RepID=UPI003440F991
MTAARFLLGAFTIVLVLVAAFLGAAAVQAGWTFAVVALVFLVCAVLCRILLFLQARAHVEMAGEIRRVSLTDMAVYQLAEVTIDCAEPDLVVRTRMRVLPGNLPSPGDPVRLTVPIHRPAAAMVVDKPEEPPLVGVAVVAGRHRIGLGRWTALAGRPVWKAMSADRLLDQAAELIGDEILDRHRGRCLPLAEGLRLTPEFLALSAAFDVPWPTIVSHAMREQEDIYDATAEVRARASSSMGRLVFFTVLLAPVALIVPDLVRVLWALLEALREGSFQPLTERVHWGAAMAGSALPAVDFYAVLGALVIVMIALVRGLVTSAGRRRRAYRSWRRDLTEMIRQRLRDEYTRIANSRPPPTLNIRSAPGFAVLSADQVVPRSEAEQLRGLVFDLGVGAVAISGSRGVGKTTLLRSTVDAQDTGALGVLVSAPVRYEPRDFLLHLYARLCQTVLDRLGNQRSRSLFGRLWSQARRLLVWALRTAAKVCLLVIPFAGARERLADHLSFPELPATYLAVSVALFVLARWLRPAVRRQEVALAAEAAKRLRRTRFLQTVSAERSVGAGRGPMQVGLRRADQWAEQPFSLPELVAEYRTFATAVADWWHGETDGRGKLLVAIDEADRIADPRLAEQFVNEIKAAFGVPHCVFLVSLSDEALAGFERRVVRIRTVFDSAFDHVVRLRALAVADSVELLRNRVAGVPDEFWILCHCLAGGMPRDVLRVARTMLDEHRTSSGPTALSLMTQRLVELEVQAVKRAFQQASPDLEPPLPALFAADSWPTASGEGLREAAEVVGSHPPVAAVFLYFATVLDLFMPREVAARVRLADGMTEVHRMVGVNPAVAVEQLRRIQAEIV